jgi:hypothetical protein
VAWPCITLGQPKPAADTFNSEGKRNRECSRAGQVVQWSGIQKETFGIAIFDHPDNPNHRWVMRDEQGLINQISLSQPVGPSPPVSSSCLNTGWWSIEVRPRRSSYRRDSRPLPATASRGANEVARSIDGAVADYS